MTYGPVDVFICGEDDRGESQALAYRRIPFPSHRFDDLTAEALKQNYWIVIKNSSEAESEDK